MTDQRKKDLREKRERDLERLRKFCLMDDEFMTKVFEDKACAELLLRIILDRDDLKVENVSSQHTIKNLQGRSVRLDILALDNRNRLYNIEIQRNDSGANVKRARYNSALMDANVTEPGEQYEMLPETYIIFITEKDVLGKNLPIYRIDRTIREIGKLFGDGSHIVYVNAQIQDKTALGKLMQDFFCTNAEEMNYSVLADRVRYFKEDKKGVKIMSKIGDELRREESLDIAERMIARGKLSYEEIAEYTGLTVEEIKALAEDMSA